MKQTKTNDEVLRELTEITFQSSSDQSIDIVVFFKIGSRRNNKEESIYEIVDMKLKKLEILIILFLAVFLSKKASNASEIQIQETYEQRKLVNILFNVPFLRFGPGTYTMFGGSADFSISKDWTLGPKFQTIPPWWGVGIDSKYNLAHPNFTSGWFINPSIDYMRCNSNYSPTSRLEVMTKFGYGWFFKNGFNINASAGPTVFTQIEARETTDNGIGLIGHFSLGYSL